jgi:rod shape-determining protein MreD
VTITPLTTRRLNPILWLGVPMALCVAATVVLALPIRIFGLRLPEPVFALVPAFAWAVIRPSVLPPFALVVLGLILDALWGGPLGLWPVCLLCAYAPILVLRPILSGQEAWILWAIYAAVCGVALAVGLAAITLRAGAMPGLIGVFWQWLASAALFPFAHRLITRYEDADVRFR